MKDQINIGEYMCLNCSHISCNRNDKKFNKCLKEFKKVIEEDIKYLSEL